MAADFIKLNRDFSTATKGQELLTFRDNLRFVYEVGTRIRAAMRHCFDGGQNPIDWTVVEQLWGLPAGDGVRVFTFVDGAVGAMEGQFQTSAAKDLTETLV